MRQIRWQRSRRYFDGGFVVLTQGNTEHASITWPNLIGLAYQKYGPTPGSPVSSVFYTPANLAISGNTASFDVTDGGLGDGDLVANGVIVDPSGPVLLATESTPVPTLGAEGLGLLLLAICLIAGGLSRRRSAFR